MYVSLTVREQSRMRVFENKVLRRIIGPKREEIIGRPRKLLNEGVRYSYSLPDIVEIGRS
jgi:hypothetical protein